MTHRKYSRGFTLLELGVVLLIIGVITAMVTSSAISIISTARQNSTVQKMAAIEQALQAFSAANSRIPCPASLTITPGSTNYGQEAGYQTGGVGTGECVTGMTPAATSELTATSELGGAAEGAVPFAALGLPSDFMYDGWGNQIRYAASLNATKAGAFTSINIGCVNGAVTVNDANGNPRTTGAMYALISHGANASGAYTKNGVLLNSTSVNANELTNCHCTTATTTPTTATTYSPTYVQMDPSSDANTGDANYWLNNFDDLVTFRERWQMQTAWDTVGACATACGTSCIYIADTSNNRVRVVTASTGVITTVAGNGTAGHSGDGGWASLAELSEPYSVAVSSTGNIYIADRQNSKIRMVTLTTGIITTIAGTTAGYSGDGGQATSAGLYFPYGVVVSSPGNIYIADVIDNRIRMVTATTGIITTIAGNGVGSYSGDGGQATSAELYYPEAVTFDRTGNIYIADTYNNRVRMVATTGIITTIAGNGVGSYAGDGGQATSAELHYPRGVALDSSSNLYIVDLENNRIRMVATTGIITTVAGNGTGNYAGDGGQATSAELHYPEAVTFDSTGNIYIADSYNSRIRMVATTGIITTVAGNGTASYAGDGGQATSAELYHPFGVAVGSR